MTIPTAGNGQLRGMGNACDPVPSDVISSRGDVNVTARERNPRRRPEELPVAKPTPLLHAPVQRADYVRASYFIARHQWTQVKRQWTCLAADLSCGWTSDDFEEFVQGHHWKFAKSMPQNPHFYTLRRNTQHAIFDDAVRYVRDQGVIEYFAGKPYTMLHHGDHKYWTMGAPLALTALINRKSTVGVVEVLQPPSGPLRFFPFIPASVESLPRNECIDVDGKPLDIDDFEDFVRLVREAGSRILGHYYLELNGYLYWTRGIPGKAQAIHRAKRPA